MKDLTLEELQKKIAELKKALGHDLTEEQTELVKKNQPFKAPNGELILPPGFSGQRLQTYLKQKK